MNDKILQFIERVAVQTEQIIARPAATVIECFGADIAISLRGGAL